MFTILHTADVHLDRAYAGPGMSAGIAAARRQELRDALRRFIDLALELRADAVTVGGDLYEHDRATADTGHFLREQLARLGQTPALLAPGNHDPYLPDSLYARVGWPANVTIFREPALRPVTLRDGLTLWGAGHDSPDLRENLLAGLRVQGAGVHLLLFHGSNVRSVPEGKASHCPFLPDEITASGARFALLGHYHSPALYPPDAPVLAYPGTPEPLDFSEDGEHQVLRLDIEPDGSVRPEFIPFGRVSYSTHCIDVSPMLTSEGIRAAICNLPVRGTIVRAVLEGPVHPDVELDVGVLYNLCAEHFAFIDIVNRTTPGYDLDELREESTTKGAFVRLMLARMEGWEGEEVEIAREALAYGLRAFDRREISV